MTIDEERGDMDNTKWTRDFDFPRDRIRHRSKVPWNDWMLWNLKSSDRAYCKKVLKGYFVTGVQPLNYRLA